MKHVIIGAALALGLAGVAQADPIEGMWKTQVDDGRYAHVSVTPCGAAFCGTIMKSFDANGEYDSPNRGKQLIRSMAPTGGGNYKGQVWRPSNDKVYIGKASVSGDTMRLSGCVAGGLICAKQNWTRLK